MKRIYWKTKKHDSLTYNGHVWEYGYWGDRLVTVRCKLCRKQPLEVLLKDGDFESCRNWRA